jgi:CO dehydrogenase/acetyl-CoA synthase alpha subunit
MTKYPIKDPAPYRNFRNVIHTCLSCQHCEYLFNGKLNCVKTINQPKPNTICDEYMELKQRGYIND